MQDAILVPPPTLNEDRLPRVPFTLKLPGLTPEGERVWSSFGRVRPADSETWVGDLREGQALFEAIVSHDAIFAAGGTESRDALLSLQGHLGQAIERGLAARAGSRLVGAEANTYVQLAARDVDGVRRWHVCERCDIVYKARRLMKHPEYRCPACTHQRVPMVRAPSRHGACWRCGGLFEPTDPQQTSCQTCRKNKSALSRHPERHPTPTSPLRRAAIDVAVAADHDKPDACLPATDEWTVHTWAQQTEGGSSRRRPNGRDWGRADHARVPEDVS